LIFDDVRRYAILLILKMKQAERVASSACGSITIVDCYFCSLQQLFDAVLAATPTQQSLIGQQSAPTEQQSLVFFASDALKQHSRTGSQHSEPVSQQL